MKTFKFVHKKEFTSKNNPQQSCAELYQELRLNSHQNTKVALMTFYEVNSRDLLLYLTAQRAYAHTFA